MMFEQVAENVVEYDPFYSDVNRKMAIYQWI